MDAPGSIRVPGRSPLAVAAGLAVVLLALYNANLREIGMVDTIPNTLMPVSLLRGSLTLDAFRPLLDSDPQLGKATAFFGAIQERDGHLRSSYPLGAPLLAVPVYLVPWAAGWLEDWSAHRVAGKLAASLLVALSAGLLYLALRECCAPTTALALAAAYGAATDAWTVASQALWQHGPGMACLALALWMALRLERRGRSSDAAVLGLALGLAVLCRSTNAAAAGALGLFVALRHPRRLPAFAPPLAAILGLLLWYNLAVFGTAGGGYGAVYDSAHLRGFGLSPETVFSHPVPSGLASILLSPAKGLLVFTPHMVFGLAAALVVWRTPGFPLGPYLTLWVAATLLLLARNQLWWGGSSFGPRYLTEALLPLTVALAALAPRILAHRWAKVALATAVLAGFATQTVGAFFTPCGWHVEPNWVDHNPDRLWSFRDPPLLRCLAAGPRELEWLEGAP